jgi:hypothetical protein
MQKSLGTTAADLVLPAGDNQASALFQLATANSFNGTVFFQGRVRGEGVTKGYDAPWVGLQAINLTTGAGAASVTADGIWRIDGIGGLEVRASFVPAGSPAGTAVLIGKIVL